MKKGTLIFSNNFRKFKLDERLLEEYDIQDISKDTIAEDFARDQKIHQTYLIKHRPIAKVKQAKPAPKKVIRKKK